MGDKSPKNKEKKKKKKDNKKASIADTNKLISSVNAKK
jgi:hypothetical protein